MQFFYLLSFAVAASYAAALPQPAELSEKYPNNVDNNLASGLEARSYQPESNSHKDSPTLVSLKRRDDSEGSSGEDSGSDSLPPPATTPKKTNGVPFTKGDINIMNLAHIIDNVGDGSVDLYKDGEKAGKKIDNPVGGLVAKYLRSRTSLLLELKLLLEGFEGGETLKGHLSAAVKSIDDFLRDQGYFYLPIMKGLGFDFSQ
ncbi:hypothetical protein BASA60_000361 [Batrachochytrium salamandrivorans]|nr:hypothetical protein BASA60_000361 [Batrachochytrium salamandrivorans]